VKIWVLQFIVNILQASDAFQKVYAIVRPVDMPETPDDK
jgi:hypothetical protein